jgi:hypothetical protein
MGYDARTRNAIARDEALRIAGEELGIDPYGAEEQPLDLVLIRATYYLKSWDIPVPKDWQKGGGGP